MARLSINEMTTYRWSFEEDVAELQGGRDPGRRRLAAKSGRPGRRSGRGSAGPKRPGVSNLLWAGGFTGSDGHTYRRKRAGRRRRDSPGGPVEGGLPGGLLRRSQQPHAQSRPTIVRRRTGELLPLAMELDVVLAIEPMYSACAGIGRF